MLFDLDCILSDIGSVDFVAWTLLFDGYLVRRPANQDEDHSPFTEQGYQQLVAGKVAR